MLQEPNPGAWLGLAVALVVLSNFGAAEWVRLTLVLAILYVLLTHGPGVAAAVDRFTLALGRRAQSGGGGASGARYAT